MIEYKKSSAVMVFNGKSELALQLRAADDNSFPAHWDFSAGGGIDEDEDEKLSAERELQEELGISAPVEFVDTQHFTYPAWQPDTTREVDLWIYKTKHDGPLSPDPSEVERAEFFSLERIREMIDAGEKFHPEFLLSWKAEIIKL
jgi:isopentenyl-diphosphate Delta-isomerase